MVLYSSGRPARSTNFSRLRWGNASVLSCRILNSVALPFPLTGHITFTETPHLPIEYTTTLNSICQLGAPCNPTTFLISLLSNEKWYEQIICRSQKTTFVSSEFHYRYFVSQLTGTLFSLVQEVPGTHQSVTLSSLSVVMRCWSNPR